MLKDGIRMDGRKVTDIRPIWSRAGVLPRTHGSALFTRGETQVGVCARFMQPRCWTFRISCAGPAREPPGQTLRVHTEASIHLEAAQAAFYSWIPLGCHCGGAHHCLALHLSGRLQALCVCTLGSEADAQRIDSIRGDVSTPDSSTDEDASSSNGSSMSYERFYLQYFFPPSSVGECGRVGPAGEGRQAGQQALVQVGFALGRS